MIMESQKSRRGFMKDCAKMGGTCCALLACHGLLPARETLSAKPGQEAKPLDLKVLSYCGIPRAYCEQQCQLFKATRDNDEKLKRALFDQWEMKKKFGIDYDPGKVFCHGCKPGDKPLKVGMAECPVRACPQANGLESCIQCLSLESCAKAYWRDWPNAFALARKLQARYRTQPGAVIKEGKAR
jgi:hypothetical protein